MVDCRSSFSIIRRFAKDANGVTRFDLLGHWPYGATSLFSYAQTCEVAK